MKLRCVTNSIRLRLKKSDITTLANENAVVETVQFPGNNALKYELCTASISSISVQFNDGHVKITLPQAISHPWINSNQVGIETQIPISSTDALHLLIEKDFPCNDRPDEDKSDTFQELAQNSTDRC